MAVVRQVPTDIPATERSFLITGIITADQIDIKNSILGRPANGFKIITNLAGDSITYRLNNRIEVTKAGTYYGTVKGSPIETVSMWVNGFGVSEYVETGATEYSSSGLPISSIEFVNVTSGGPIQMVVW